MLRLGQQRMRSGGRKGTLGAGQQHLCRRIINSHRLTTGLGGGQLCQLLLIKQKLLLAAATAVANQGPAQKQPGAPLVARVLLISLPARMTDAVLDGINDSQREGDQCQKAKNEQLQEEARRLLLLLADRLLAARLAAFVAAATCSPPLGRVFLGPAQASSLCAATAVLDWILQNFTRAYHSIMIDFFLRSGGASRCACDARVHCIRGQWNIFALLAHSGSWPNGSAHTAEEDEHGSEREICADAKLS